MRSFWTRFIETAQFVSVVYTLWAKFFEIALRRNCQIFYIRSWRSQRLLWYSKMIARTTFVYYLWSNICSKMPILRNMTENPDFRLCELIKKSQIFNISSLEGRRDFSETAQLLQTSDLYWSYEETALPRTEYCGVPWTFMVWWGCSLKYSSLVQKDSVCFSFALDFFTGPRFWWGGSRVAVKDCRDW